MGMLIGSTSGGIMYKKHTCMNKRKRKSDKNSSLDFIRRYRRLRRYAATSRPICIRAGSVLLYLLKKKQEDIWRTYAFFCYRASNSRALHFTLRVDNNTGVVLEVKEDTVSSAPCLALTDNDNWHG